MKLSSASEAPRPGRFRDLAVRAVSAVVMAPLALAAVWYDFPWFDLLVALATVLMVGEWGRMVGGRRRWGWLAAGYAYIALAVLAAQGDLTIRLLCLRASLVGQHGNERIERGILLGDNGEAAVRGRFRRGLPRLQQARKLRREQAEYIARRNKEYGRPGYDLKKAMRGRLQQINGIDGY